MSYRINRTDGELLLDLTDGMIDTTATDITLIGRNYKGFGEWINENFVHILENFASTQQPTNPLTGQVWYDKQDQRLKVFDGVIFKTASGVVVNSDTPRNLVAGDIWINNDTNRLYIYDGVDLTLIGPTYTAGQGKTGFEADSQIDIDNITHTILKLFIGGTLAGIFATEDFYIPYDFIIHGYDADPEDTLDPPRQHIKRGFNLAQLAPETGLDGFWWRGTAVNAKNLVDDSGNVRGTDSFLPTDADGTTTGSLTIKNSNGLSIGIGDSIYRKDHLFGQTAFVDLLDVDWKFDVRLKNGSFPNTFITGMSINGEELTTKMWEMPNITLNPTTGTYDFIGLNEIPSLEVYGDGFFARNLDVAGSVNIVGDLQVEGNVSYVSTENLYIKDKNIELAIDEDNNLFDNATVDGGGITLKSSDGDKYINWLDTTKAWTLNQNLEITAGPSDADPEFFINGNSVLSSTTLGLGITDALGLQRIGNLDDVTVDNVFINDNKLEIINGAVGFIIEPNGPVDVNENRIVNVTDPIDNLDVVNRQYLESVVRAAGIQLAFDINGLLVGNDPRTQPYNAGTIENVRLVSEQLRPAAFTLTGTQLTVLATRVSEMFAKIPIRIRSDNTGTIQVSKVTVRNVDNTGTVAVVQDIVSNDDADPEQAEVFMTVERFKYTFISDGTNWVNPVVEQIVI